MLGRSIIPLFLAGNSNFKTWNVQKSFSVVCDCDKIAFSGLVSAKQHMLVTYYVNVAYFEHSFFVQYCKVNTSPQLLDAQVALFDPIGSPLINTGV